MTEKTLDLQVKLEEESGQLGEARAEIERQGLVIKEREERIKELEAILLDKDKQISDLANKERTNVAMLEEKNSVLEKQIEELKQSYEKELEQLRSTHKFLTSSDIETS